MGGTSTSSSTQSQSLAPYAPAAGTLNGILGSVGTLANSTGVSPTSSNAINTEVANGNTLNPALMSSAMGLLNGGGATNNDAAIKGNLGTLNSGIVGTTASGANIGNDTALTNELQTVGTNAANTVNSEFAAAGRSGSPGQSAAMGTAITNAEAPLIQAQYNTDTTNALNAANTLYGAGNTTYGMLNSNQAQSNANQEAGATQGNAAATNESNVISADQDNFNIPASQYQTLLGMVSPVAAQFGTQSGQSNSTSTMSPVQQFATILQGIGSLVPKSLSFGTGAAPT
jgi:hypothetical protein